MPHPTHTGNTIDTTAYLHRIRYQGSLAVNSDTLVALQLAHLQAVPFENLSIHHGQAIDLDTTLLFQKIVTQQRGGFCYELNGLFAVLLEQLGFMVTRMSARVATSQGGWGPEFDHLMLLVQLEEDYLVDVGFGDSFLLPLRLHSAQAQVQGHMAYQITSDGVAYTLSQQSSHDAVPSMQAQLRFSTTARQLAEFEPMCQFHQHSPDSHFTQKRICSLATPQGRVSLSDHKLIETQPPLRSERLLASPDEYSQILKTVFDITLPSQTGEATA